MNHRKVDYVMEPSREDNPAPIYLCITRSPKRLGDTFNDQAQVMIAKHDGKHGIPARDACDQLNRSYLWIWTLCKDRLIDGYRMNGILWVYLDEARAIKDARDKEREYGKLRKNSRVGSNDNSTHT